MAKNNKSIKIFLLVLLGVAAFLRLWKLSEVPVSLFGDELDVGYQAYSILKTGKDYSGNPWPLHFHSLAEWRTPLYLYSAVPTVALFGITPLGVRLPAAFFGILGVYGIYLLVKKLTGDESVSIISGAVLAFSSWHIQYSRAAFEVTMLMAFYLFGLYFFLISVIQPRHSEQVKRVEGSCGKYLWFSMVLLTFTPWIYSTAKLFTPLLFVLLFLLWKKEILNIPKKELVKAILAGLVVGLPIFYSTLFGGGSQRFGYISVFSDPTRETEIGYAREFDAEVRGDIQLGLKPSFSDRIFHNKLVFWGKNILANYFQAFSTDFLFVNGDPNPRHSIKEMGQFYKIEITALILGILFFFTSKYDCKTKLLIAFWVLVGVVPAAITRDGGNHATRLILILPPLIFLISHGIVSVSQKLNGVFKWIFYTAYFILLSACFVFYQHNYWIHNPWDSERWWHAGWKEAVQSIKEVEDNYDNVVISMAGEPAWIFFASYYEYSPEKWQAEFPIGNDVLLDGFGKISHVDKYYFGSLQIEGSFYDWGKVLKSDTLYLANAKEVNVNLVKEPDRTPNDLNLIKSIAYPSGEPAFYLFSGASNELDRI